MAQQRGSWLGNQSLLKKIILALGVVMLCFAAASLFTLHTFDSEDEISARDVLKLDLIDTTAETIEGIRLQQLAVRDMLTYGRTVGQADIRATRAQRDRALDRAIEQAPGIAPAAAPMLLDARRSAREYDALIDDLMTREAAVLDHAQDSAGDVTRISADYLPRLLPIANAMIESLVAVRDGERANLRTDRELVARRIGEARLITLSLLAGGLVLSLLSLWLTTRLVVRPIRELTSLMTRLAADDHSIEIPMQRRKDEIGAIARALEVFLRNSIASHERNWIKANAAEVSAAAQGADCFDSFAAMLASEIGRRLGAGIGVFYAWDDDRQTLQLAGSYGYRERKHLSISYAVGEGLVGQCARERRVIILEPVPDDYIRIHSGVGEASPRSVIVLPLLLRNHLLGVLEFGSFTGFSPAQQAFLDDVLPLLALGLDNMRRAEHTRHLLEQTQAQAQALQASEEAMRAQQEALRSSNQELQDKTVELEENAQRLLASEEELRVQAEELQASNEELRQKGEILNEQKNILQRLQTETQVKADQLAQASQYKSDFLANMSHELRTPLNSLLILSHGLAENESGNLSPDEVESAQVIHDSGSNLLRLINDILDLSKIEAGKMEVYREDIDLDGIVQSVQRHFRHVASDKGIRLDISIGHDVPRQLHTDGAKLQQILNNLLGNAFKFTRDGGVTLKVEVASRDQVDAAGLVDTPAIALAVADSGIGIPADRLQHIFDAFEQVDSSTSRHYGGSGLGLSIARRLANLLGGQLLAESQVGVGSTFTLVLPQVAAGGGVEPGSAAVAPNPPALHPRAPAIPAMQWIADDRNQIEPGETVILTIEDDPAFARILVDMIRRKGHRALAAGDGESGLALARKYRPTGVLLDVMLPGMDGWSVMEHLKGDPLTRHIPVHFISAVDDTVKGKELGAIGFLTKPVDRKALTLAFDYLLEVAGQAVRCVLLVDDDEDSRLAITRLLRSDAVEIDEAESGEQALEMIGQRNYDCIVLDLSLGGISGIEFLEKAVARGPIPPVVIYSARDLSPEESLKLRHYTDSIVIKGSRSSERLLDEVSLFLHSMKSSGGHAATAVDDDLHGRRVLIVDDDMRNIFALSKALRAKGVDVLMAQDGYKALRQLADHPGIELVLMDIMMPGMDGYETMREIRGNPSHARLPIIAVTAKAMQGDRDKCLEAGANDYLAKPIDIDKLMSMMHVWLQR